MGYFSKSGYLVPLRLVNIGSSYADTVWELFTWYNEVGSRWEAGGKVIPLAFNQFVMNTFPLVVWLKSVYEHQINEVNLTLKSLRMRVMIGISISSFLKKYCSLCTHKEKRYIIIKIKIFHYHTLFYVD